MSFLSYAGIAFFVYILLSAITFVVTGVINAPLFSPEQFLLAGQIAVVVIGLMLFVAIIRPKN